MKIILEKIPSILPDFLSNLRDDFLFTVKDKDLSTVPTFESIILGKLNLSEALKYRFYIDFKFFNKLLLQIHYKRHYPLSKNQRLNLLKYLTIGYINSNDVRYFNEFLWFYKSDEIFENLKKINLNNFKNNLDANNCHSIPNLSKKEIFKYISKFNKQNSKKTELKRDYRLKIALIGIPFIFKNVFSTLKNMGYSVSLYVIPHYTEIKRRIFLKSGAIFKAYNKIKGVKFPYTILNFNYKDKKIKDLLLKEKLDVGFFKLGFIAQDNIYDCFKIGLLHDHLAVLPFIRGRSSVEFSLLTGIPVGSTIHFISKGIDTGDIVEIYTYNVQQGENIISIRKKIKKDFEKRIYDSLKKISHNQKGNFKNDTSKGLTYYSIHPELYNFINRSIINKNTEV